MRLFLMKEIHFVLILFLLFAMNNETNCQIKLIENAVDSSAGNVPCYKIETSSAIYYLEKEGVGLSSMIDNDGNDWISFHNKPGSGAAGEYRGFPNAVHQQDGSFFHPKNEGTQSSTTRIIYQGKDKVSIRGVSGNGNWECLWDFYTTHCTFTMTRMPKGFKYWILYEGTPGGEYNNDDWYFTSNSSEKKQLTNNYEKDIPSPEWIAFGDKKLERSLFLIHHEDDNHIDKFYQMQEKMTVFGFGRDGLTKYLETVPQSFSIGLTESQDYKKVRKTVRKIYQTDKKRK